MITLQKVCLSYRTESETVVALDNVDFFAKSGDMVAVMGASGSGKTTLINAISGISSVDSGEIIAAGHTLHTMSASQRANARLADIGVIFQDHNLIPEFTSLENVILPLRALGVPFPEAKAEEMSLLVKVGLSGLEDRYPKELSGGQKQRVGIARALTGGKKFCWQMNLPDPSTKKFN